MLAAQTVRNFLDNETFVQITKNGDFVSKTYWWIYGRIVRWIHPAQYFDLSTLWKAHQCVTTILTSSQDVPSQQRKLRSLRGAIDTLAGDGNAKLNALQERIDTAVARLAPHQGEEAFSAPRIASRFVDLISGKDMPNDKALETRFRGYTAARKKQIELLVIEYFFEPILIQASSVMMKSGLSQEIYHDALLKVIKSSIPIVQAFGRKEIAKILDQYHFLDCVETNFLFPLLENWIKAYHNKNKNIVDTLVCLHKYINEILSLCPDRGNEKSWSNIKEKFRKILATFFSQKVSLSLFRPFSPLQRPAHLSEAYVGDIPKQAEELVFPFAEHTIFDPEKTAPMSNSGHVFSESNQACSASVKSQFFNLFGYNKQQIEDWLSSLQDVESLLGELPRLLNVRGVYVGEKTITADSLQIPPQIQGQDRDILLCWGLFQEVAAFFKENGVKDPEQAAKSLMTFSTLQYGSFIFFSTLGALADCIITGCNLTSQQLEPDQKIGLSFSCQDRGPLVHWEEVFHQSRYPEKPGFFVRATIQQKKVGFTETLETTPCVFSGYGFHIEEADGAYKLYQDSLSSELRSAFGSQKIFFFSKEDVAKFKDSVDQHLKVPQEATVVSLRHLEKDIRALCFMKNIPFSKKSPVAKVLAKVESVKQEAFEEYDVAFGKALAQELVATRGAQDITLESFFTHLDEEIADIQKRNKFPARLLEGLFAELKDLCPLHLERFEEKERLTQLSLMQERIARAVKNSDPQTRYDLGIHEVQFLASYYMDQFPDLIEKIYIEKVAPLALACSPDEILLRDPILKRLDIALGLSIAQKFLKEHEETDKSEQDLLALVDQEILEIQKRNMFPAKILEGFFLELKNKFQKYLEPLKAKEQDTHLEVMKEWIDKELTGVDSRGDYDQCIRSLQFFKSVYVDRYPDLLEKVFVEKAVPLFAAWLKTEISKDEEEKFQELETDIYAIKGLFPEPQTQFLAGISALSRDVLFWLGLEIGKHIEAEVLKSVHQMDAWFSKTCSQKQVREVAEGMRRSSGLKYGAAIAEEIKDLNGTEFFEAISRERNLTPCMYSQVVRGMLSTLDHFPDQEEVKGLCKRYAEDILIRLFDVTPLEYFFQYYFKPFLCGPYSKSSSMIITNFLQKISEKPEHVGKNLFSALEPAVQSEIQLMFDEEDWEEKQQEYFGSVNCYF